MVRAAYELVGTGILALLISALAAVEPPFPSSPSPEPAIVASSDGIVMPFTPPPEEVLEEQ